MEPNATTVVIGVGDFLYGSSGKCLILAAAAGATGDDGFVGVAMSTNLSGYTTKVTIARRARVRVYQTGFAGNNGAGVLYSSGANGTDWVFADGSGANLIGWLSKTFTTADTYIEFDIDTIALGKFFAATA
mgnify:FL=1